jgi:NAD(P)-dependent dehydrogenase (short-subunit alcohol dehydrogenase family)
MRFVNKVALITAAANGIGRATAQIMAREGATGICTWKTLQWFCTKEG